MYHISTYLYNVKISRNLFEVVNIRGYEAGVMRGEYPWLRFGIYHCDVIVEAVILEGNVMSLYLIWF